MADVPAPRVALAVGLVMVALAFQVTLFSRLPLPGATPDVVLLAVVALALAHGPGFGMVTGFCAGLATDLVPPADHAVGRWALALCVVGYAAGLLRSESRRSAFLPLVVVAVTAVVSLLLFAATGMLVDDPNVTWEAVVRLLPTVVAYDVLLSPFIVSAVLALAHRVEPDPMSRA